jgi:hypothetical protein
VINESASEFDDDESLDILIQTKLVIVYTHPISLETNPMINWD